MTAHVNTWPRWSTGGPLPRLHVVRRDLIFVFDGATGSYDWHGGVYAPSGAWTEASATTAGGTEAYNFGTTGHTDANFGRVVGSFTGIPTCTTPEVPATVTGNDGEYVSGAAHAGIKGTEWLPSSRT